MQQLQEQVDARYAELDLPSWPPPRDPMASPRDEEYSRVTDAGRYRIVHARAQAWADTLAALPDVTLTTLDPGHLVLGEQHDHTERVLQLTSDRPGTLPLLLLERNVPVTEPDGTATDTAYPRHLPVVHVAAGDPQAEITFQPDCGCDACDTGSEDLLQAVDEAVRQVVDGPLVVLRGPGWYAHWHRDGGSSGGSGRGPNHEKVMALCRRLAKDEDVTLPSGTRAWVGQPWL